MLAWSETKSCLLSIMIANANLNCRVLGHTMVDDSKLLRVKFVYSPGMLFTSVTSQNGTFL